MPKTPFDEAWPALEKMYAAGERFDGVMLTRDDREDITEYIGFLEGCESREEWLWISYVFIFMSIAFLCLCGCSTPPKKQPELCHVNSQGLTICKGKPVEYTNPQEVYHDLDMD